MKTFLITALTALTLTSVNAYAGEADVENSNLEASAETRFDTESLIPGSRPSFNINGSIAVARLDGGRLIPTPYEEERDWTFLDRRTDIDISQLGAGTYIKYTPEIPYGSYDTDNKIDEIRLAASNEDYDYVLIYGVGPDAGWASFGGKVLSETGLTVSDDCQSWDGAKAKALLVESRSGHVLGAVTANNIEFNIGQLADRVEGLINDLSKSDTDMEATKA